MKSRLHKPGTVDTYERHLRNHIDPAFGGLGLAAIRATTVQQWVKDLQAVKGLAPRTVETIYGIFSSIMRGAIRDGYLRKSPCIDIRLPDISPRSSGCCHLLRWSLWLRQCPSGTGSWCSSARGRPSAG